MNIEQMNIEEAFEALTKKGWFVELRYDDDGNWAVCDKAFGSVKFTSNVYFDEDDWKPTIREAWIHFVKTRGLK